MLFLSFQEFLKYFHLELSKLQDQAQLCEYLERYHAFCRKYHVYGNHCELFREGLVPQDERI